MQTIRRRLTNTLSKTWGEYSSTDEYFLENMGEYSEDEYISKTRANIRPWMNTFSKTWANFVRGRIVSRKRGANIRPWTNTFSKTWVEYSSVDDWSLENVGTISLSKTWGEYSSVDECYLFDGWFSRVFVKTIGIRAGCAIFP